MTDTNQVTIKSRNYTTPRDSAALSEQGLEFSVGYPATEAIRNAIRLVPKWAWQAADNSDGGLREHADVIEVTGLLDLSRWRQTCPGMRVLVRRELPHPGARLDALEIRDGYRFRPSRPTGLVRQPH